MMDVEYNGILASSLGIYAKNIPDIPAAVRKEKTVDIPGMDGTLILLEGGYESTEIKVDFNFIGDSDRWDERFGLAKKWLSKRGGLLRFGCDPEHYYKILKVEVDDGNSALCELADNVIAFSPRSGFFAVGMNELQIRIINEDKTLVSFAEKVKCSGSAGFPDDEEEDKQTLVEQAVTAVSKESGERKTADENEKAQRIAGDQEERDARIEAINLEKSERDKAIEAEKNARIKADDEIKANRAKTLDAVKTTTKEGTFADALAVKELSEKMDDIDVKTENLGKKIAIFVDSVVKGSVSFNTSDYLKDGVKYAFTVTVSSAVNDTSCAQEISCKLNNTLIGQNGNYCKLSSTFCGRCSKGDTILVTSYKNGGEWSMFNTRLIFVPVD